MEMLLREELNLVERTQLGNFTLHPGFEILKRMMAAACTQATERVIKIDPMSDGYERKLAAAQNAARSTNEFCAALLKSLQVHVEAGVKETQQQEEEQAILAALVK